MKRLTSFMALFLLVFVVFGQNLVQNHNLQSPQVQSLSSTPLNLEQINQQMHNNAERTPDGLIRCFSSEYEEMMNLKHPNMQTREEFEAWLAPKVADYKLNAANNSSNKAVITVPVIMHIIHNSNESVGQGRNISYAQALSQITILNDDFRRLNADASNTPAAFQPVAADLEISFVPALRYASNHPLAGQDLAEPGVNRVSTADITGVSNTTSGYQASGTDLESRIKPQTYWDRTEVMNIWVCQLSGGVLGYAQFPTGSGLGGLNLGGATGANTDGLVLGYNYTGTGGVTQAPFNKGRTATHEIGHWAGLRHIWGDGGCGVDDYCNDTPESDAANYGCTQSHTSCGTTDMVQNYMDYSDDACMNLFTEDQKARVQTVFANSPGRSELPSSQLGSVAAINADFTGTPTTINEGGSVTFTDNSSSPDNLQTWNWTFNGGTPASYTGQTPPAITYATAGQYDVSLTVTDDNSGTDTETKTMYITVNPAGTSICDSTAAGWDWNTENFGGSYWADEDNDGNPEGYIMGNNNYNDNGWATKVPFSGANKELTDVLFVFVQSTGSGAATLNIWNADGAGQDINGGSVSTAPGTVMASASVSTGDFNANLNQFIALEITPAIPLTGDFYIGYEHNSTPANGDTLVMGLSIGATTNMIWAKESGIGWRDINYWGSGAGTGGDAMTYEGTVVPVICDITTGIKSHNAEVDQLHVYPNPSTGQVNVILPTKTNSSVSVFNMVGENVYNTSSSSNFIGFDLSNQPNGVYFIKVTSNGEVTTKKVLLSK